MGLVDVPGLPAGDAVSIISTLDSAAAFAVDAAVGVPPESVLRAWHM